LRRYGESKAHEKAKERVGEILRAGGYQVWIDTYSFECKTPKGPRTYWPDVYAESADYQAIKKQRTTQGSADVYGENRKYRQYASSKARHTIRRARPAGARRIIVEIQGFKGHNSTTKDQNRIADIRAHYGHDIEYVPLLLSAVQSRTTDDELIKEELGINS